MNFAAAALSRWAGFALVVLAVLAAPIAQAADADLGTHVGTLVVPDGLTADEVKQVIALSLAARGWTVKEKKDDRVVGYLKHRANEATLTLTYDKTNIDLHCVGYQVNKKTGERQKPELPSGWIGNIKKDFTKRLNQRAALK